MTGQRGLMQWGRVAVEALRVVAIGILTGIEEQADDLHVPELGSQGERAMPVVPARRGEQALRVLESSQARGGGEGGDSRPASHQGKGGVPESKDQGGHERRNPVARPA